MKWEFRPDRMAAVRYPDKGNVGGQNSGYEISGWNKGEFRPGRMCDATLRKGGRLRVQEKGSHVAVFRETTIWVVGGFSADHDLGSRWLCKRFRGGYGRLHNHQGKNCRVSLFKGLLQP